MLLRCPAVALMEATFVSGVITQKAPQHAQQVCQAVQPLCLVCWHLEFMPCCFLRVVKSIALVTHGCIAAVD